MLLMSHLLLQAQQYELQSTTEIYRKIQALQQGTRVLYIAAHPDDENTRLISWLENDQHIETAYLSLTRGQGGQNLIGDEKGDALGVIRTFELMEARKVDGGEQFFTRAIDFGYSKSAEESYDFWGKQAVLSDVVYVIRHYRPHLIITRFPPNRNAGHGHHEASALLAEEAFDLAADENAFPEQLNEVATWQTTALYFNASSWWDKSLAELSDEALLERKMHKLNVGAYNELLGMGVNEIASMARSKHRCQAFGTPRVRGDQEEFLQFIKGTWSENLLDAFPTIWQTSPGHADAFQAWLDAYDFTNRAANLSNFEVLVQPKLAQRSLWAQPEDIRYVNEKVQEILHELNGVRVEIFADEDPIVVNSDYKVSVEVYNSSSESQSIAFKNSLLDTSISVAPGKTVSWETTFTAPDRASTPYWLQQAHDGWLYAIPSQLWLAKPVDDPLAVEYQINRPGAMPIKATTPVHRKWNDRSIGEIVQPLLFVNPVSINPAVSSLVLKKGEQQRLRVSVVANQELINAKLNAKFATDGWEISGHEEVFSLKKGQLKNFDLIVYAKDGAAQSDLMLGIAFAGQIVANTMQLINYPHIPNIAMHTLAKVSLVPLDLNLPAGKKILYIEGSGDEVDDGLELLGFEVDRKPLNGLNLSDLSQYNAIVTGIRAFNTNDELPANINLLHAYVMQGGKLVVQYNTTYDLKVEQIGPYPMTISRNRVTNEQAQVSMLSKNHPVFNVPNKLDESDWSGWVQERGLYFAGEWDERYTPLIAWSDAGEEQQKGGLLFADYGKGSFIYTGISFFRQIPGGVPGAYRLLVNILANDGSK